MRSLVPLACALALALGGSGCGADPAESTAPVVIWAVGDGGGDNEPSRQGGGPSANDPPRQVVDLIAKDHPTHVIYLGDVYETGSPQEFETFGAVYGPLLKRIL